MALALYRFGMTGQALTVRFAIEDVDNEAFFTGALAAGDCLIGLDGAAPVASTNLPTHNGSGVWSLVVTAAEMQARFVNIVIADLTASAAFRPVYIQIMTEIRVGQIEIDLTSSSLDTNGAALILQGLGNQAGLYAEGGATGAGGRFIGGATSGAGVFISGTAGNSAGLDIDGQGSASGIDSTGGATGHGILGTGGATSGSGIRGVGAAGNSPGIDGAGQGSSHGILGTGGATGHGINGIGGATSGVGIRGVGTAGNSAGVSAVGQDSASGLEATGGATGNGILGTGGATSGHGVSAQSAAGNSHGILASGRGTGQGLSTTHATDNSLMTNIFDTLEGTEPSGAIASNATLKQVLQYLKRRSFNKATQTNSTRTMYKDDSTTSLQTQACANDGTTESQNKAT